MLGVLVKRISYWVLGLGLLILILAPALYWHTKASAIEILNRYGSSNYAWMVTDGAKLDAIYMALLGGLIMVAGGLMLNRKRSGWWLLLVLLIGELIGELFHLFFQETSRLDFISGVLTLIVLSVVLVKMLRLIKKPYFGSWWTGG